LFEVEKAKNSPDYPDFPDKPKKKKQLSRPFNSGGLVRKTMAGRNAYEVSRLSE
jgi:hypothetical protein